MQNKITAKQMEKAVAGDFDKLINQMVQAINKAQPGSWYPKTQAWVRDDVTSPCIDAGDPASPIGDEPFPNGGRINMGAYGGTAEASKTYFGKPPCETIIAGDINGDCKVDFKDFVLMAWHWLEERDS